MCTNPKNRLTPDEIFKSDYFCDKGKMKAVKRDYHCDNYIQAITLKETLKIIAGKEYTIEQNGAQGWKVVAQEDN